MLAKVDEVYRGYGIVWTTGKAGPWKPFCFLRFPSRATWWDLLFFGRRRLRQMRVAKCCAAVLKP